MGAYIFLRSGTAASQGIQRRASNERQSWRNSLPINPPANSIRWPFPGFQTKRAMPVNAAFDAMSTWRTETVDNSEKNLEEVIEKMAAAARALGWPEQIVDATRSQIQSVTKRSSR